MWTLVRGPAAALIASLFRIGWKSPEPGVLLDCHGWSLDLLSVSPSEIRFLVSHAAKEAIWEAWSKSTPGAPARPFIEPLKKLLEFLWIASSFT